MVDRIQQYVYLHQPEKQPKKKGQNFELAQPKKKGQNFELAKFEFKIIGKRVGLSRKVDTSTIGRHFTLQKVRLSQFSQLN